MAKKKEKKRSSVIKPRPKWTIYTSLLVVASLALLVGCTLLLLETAKFGGGGLLEGLSAIRQGPGS